jgi:hypothetical protein
VNQNLHCESWRINQQKISRSLADVSPNIYQLYLNVTDFRLKFIEPTSLNQLLVEKIWMLLASDLVAPEWSNNMENRYTSCSWLFRFAVRFPLLWVNLFIGFRIILHDVHFKTLLLSICSFSRPRFRDIFSSQGGILVFVTSNTRNHYRPQYQVRERKSQPRPVRFSIWELFLPFLVLSGRHFVLSSTAHARRLPVLWITLPFDWALSSSLGFSVIRGKRNGMECSRWRIGGVGGDWRCADPKPVGSPSTGHAPMKISATCVVRDQNRQTHSVTNSLKYFLGLKQIAFSHCLVSRDFVILFGMNPDRWNVKSRKSQRSSIPNWNSSDIRWRAFICVNCVVAFF